MALSEAHERYEQLVEAEDLAIRQSETCELTKNALFDLVYKSQEELDSLTIEDIVTAVHAIDQRLQSNLLELRLEKSSLARKLKQFSFPLT